MELRFVAHSCYAYFERMPNLSVPRAGHSVASHTNQVNSSRSFVLAYLQWKVKRKRVKSNWRLSYNGTKKLQIYFCLFRIRENYGL